MQQAANQVAVSLDNALNYKVALAHQQQLSRERDRLGLLLDVTNALVSSLISMNCLPQSPIVCAV